MAVTSKDGFNTTRDITSVLALALLAPNPAIAQDSAADGGGVQEIIVTAQKRAESLQDVPIAITALGSEQLEQRGITGLANLHVSPLRVRKVPGARSRWRNAPVNKVSKFYV